MDGSSLPLWGMLVFGFFALWAQWCPRKWFRVVVIFSLCTIVSASVGLAVWANVHKVVASIGYGFVAREIWIFARVLWSGAPIHLPEPPQRESSSADLVPAADLRASEAQVRALDHQVRQMRQDREAEVNQLNSTIQLYQRGVVSGPGPIRQLMDGKQAAENKARGLQLKVDTLEAKVESLEGEGVAMKARIPKIHDRWEHMGNAGISKRRRRRPAKGALSPDNKLALFDAAWGPACGVFGGIQQVSPQSKHHSQGRSGRERFAAVVPRRPATKGTATNRENSRTIQGLVSSARQQNMVLTNHIGGLEGIRDMEATAATHTHHSELESTYLTLERARESTLAGQSYEHEERQREIIRQHEAKKLNAKAQMAEVTRQQAAQNLDSQGKMEAMTCQHAALKLDIHARMEGLTEQAASNKSLLERTEARLAESLAENVALTKRLDRAEKFQGATRSARGGITKSKPKHAKLRDGTNNPQQSQRSTEAAEKLRKGRNMVQRLRALRPSSEDHVPKADEDELANICKGLTL
ncbi:hypothetical protein N7444_006136 [Penicillium canescens]|nr:hypothetical protein N7444_006136 [Penicillium canescens]